VLNCTSVLSKRKDLQTEIAVVFVIMLSVPHKKSASHTKINYDVINKCWDFQDKCCSYGIAIGCHYREYNECVSEERAT